LQIARKDESARLQPAGRAQRAPAHHLSWRGAQSASRSGAASQRAWRARMSAQDPTVNSPEIRRLARVIEPGHNYASVTDKISSIVLTRPVSIGWFAGFAVAFALLMLMTVSIAWLITKGVGIWGINIPIGWGFAIVNFVWWIGIGHAGKLISAILFFLNQ